MELLRYESIGSTQDTARQLVLDSHPLPFAVLAQTQSNGRGRLGKKWQSSRGGLWITIALDVPSAEVVQEAALVAAFAVAHAVQTLTAVEMQVKWPNDLLVGRRKVCGILAEALILPETTTLLLGIGINANNPVDEASTPRATSLKDELNRPVSVEDLSTAVITEVNRGIDILTRQGFSPFQPWLESRLALMGESITVEFNGQRECGRVRGISKTGALLLADSNGLVREVDAGSVYCW
ncbi:MAG: biotin--[acetyl-CoA-carboxylase] ligase [Candidatus Cryosericum sp.]